MLSAVFGAAQSTFFLGCYMRLPAPHPAQLISLPALCCHGHPLDGFWMLHHDIGVAAKKDVVLLALTDHSGTFFSRSTEQSLISLGEDSIPPIQENGNLQTQIDGGQPTLPLI
jgi:hypothetical protein